MTPSPNNSNSTRPAQVLLTERDRDLSEHIAQRVRARGSRVSGPTALYRAGLLALRALNDDALVRTFDEVEERLSEPALLELFEAWCAQIVQGVAKAHPDLGRAWEAMSDSEHCLGYFSHMGRFVALSLNVQDGRVFITGMGMANGLFPTGLATLSLSMNEAGAALAVRAVVAWLTGTDDDIRAIRTEISKHRAEPLR